MDTVTVHTKNVRFMYLFVYEYEYDVQLRERVLPATLRSNIMRPSKHKYYELMC